MNTPLERLSSLIVGFYAWISAIFFGAILLDISYSNFLSDVLSTSESTLVFSNVSDFLLLIGSVTILAAIGAIVFSWKERIARNLFIASLVIVIFEFLTPVLALQFIENAQDLNIGPWLRILPSGLASLLAFIGLYNYYRQK